MAADGALSALECGRCPRRSRSEGMDGMEVAARSSRERSEARAAAVELLAELGWVRGLNFRLGSSQNGSEEASTRPCCQPPAWLTERVYPRVDKRSRPGGL